MALPISVVPAGEGWAVRSPAFENDMFFQGGAKAETTARRLADQYARAGIAAEVNVFLRDGALAGSFRHPAMEMELSAA